MNKNPLNKRTLSIAALCVAGAIAAGSPAQGDDSVSGMAKRFQDFQTRKARETLLENALNRFRLTRRVTKTVDRMYRYQIRVGTGVINPTNAAMFDSDLQARNAEKLDLQLGLSDAHAQSTGRDVVVAVLDSGFNLNHPSIASRVLPYEYDAVGNDYDAQDTGNGSDDDNDGKTDVGVGHGTFVAGMVLKAAPDAWILPVRTADDEGYGTEDDVVNGLDFAVSMGVNVINISYESGFLSARILQKIEEAHTMGIVVVVSSGNSGADDTGAMADNQNTISVGAVDYDDRIADFSNVPTNGEGLSLFAPGVDLYGPHGGESDDADCIWSGTSFAAPFVAGAAALALESQPGVSPAQVHDLMRGATNPVMDEQGAAYHGAGCLDLRKVVNP